ELVLGQPTVHERVLQRLDHQLAVGVARPKPVIARHAQPSPAYDVRRLTRRSADASTRTFLAAAWAYDCGRYSLLLSSRPSRVRTCVLIRMNRGRASRFGAAQWTMTG